MSSSTWRGRGCAHSGFRCREEIPTAVTLGCHPLIGRLLSRDRLVGPAGAQQENGQILASSPPPNHGRGIPTDRGKPGTKYHLLTDRNGLPLHILASAANVHDSRLFEPLLETNPGVRGRHSVRAGPGAAQRGCIRTRAFTFPRCRRYLHREGHQGACYPPRNRGQEPPRSAPLGRAGRAGSPRSRCGAGTRTPPSTGLSGARWIPIGPCGGPIHWPSPRHGPRHSGSW